MSPEIRFGLRRGGGRITVWRLRVVWVAPVRLRRPFSWEDHHLLRITCTTIAMLTFVSSAPAFFLFLGPVSPAEPQLMLFAGDRPKAEEKVSTDAFTGAKVQILAPDGSLSSSNLGPNSSPKLDPTRVSAVMATVEYGVITRGASPMFVVHHAKFVAKPSEKPTLGGQALEITPIVRGSEVCFRVTSQGNAKAGVDVSVWVLGEKSARAVRTDETGTTPGFKQMGEYSVRCSTIEKQDGEHVGRKYGQVRHYATLVTAVSP